MKRAFAASLPIALGYIPLGLVCGILLRRSGLNAFEILLMSILVFAGSSQFVAASLFAASASLIQIMAATFIINLRQMLYTSTFVRYTRKSGPGEILLLAQVTSDETYGVNIQHFEQGDWDTRLAIGVGLCSNLYWALGNVIGALVGEVIRIPVTVASFILTSMFIVLLAFQLKAREYIIMALVAASLSIAVFSFYRGGGAVILIALLCAGIGYVFDGKLQKKSQEEVS